MISAPCECTRHQEDFVPSSLQEEEMRMIQCEVPPRAPRRIIQKLLHPTQTFDYSCHGRNWIISEKVRAMLTQHVTAWASVANSD